MSREVTSTGPPELVEHFFRHESAKLIAVLTRAFGVRCLDLVEDKVQEAMLTAVEVWSRRGIPDNPAGWIYRVARNRVLDALRREKIHQRALALAHQTEEAVESLVDVLFATQEQWVSSPNPMQALGNIGRQAGISEADFDACMENAALADQILRRAREAEERYGVDSTPSFVINGETFIGNQPFDRFEAAIERLIDG